MGLGKVAFWLVVVGAGAFGYAVMNPAMVFASAP